MPSFRKLPPELREKIFAPNIDWDGRTPILIVALRPDLQLYQEALSIFYRTNYFLLHKGNGFSFGEMGAKALATITKVKIDYEGVTSWHPRYPCDQLDLKIELGKGPNVNEVYLLNAFFRADILSGVKGLRKVQVEIQFGLATWRVLERGRIYEEMVTEKGTESLGVEAGLEREDALIDASVVQMRRVWAWEAEKGKFLSVRT